MAQTAMRLLNSILPKLLMKDMGIIWKIQKMRTITRNTGSSIINGIVTNGLKHLSANNGTITEYAFCNVTVLQIFWQPLSAIVFSYNLFIRSLQTYLLYPFPPLLSFSHSRNNQETMKFQKLEYSNATHPRI